MDRDPPFTFEAGNSGPQNDVATGGAQPAGTDAIVAGRIDPELARLSATASESPSTTSAPGISTGNGDNGNASDPAGNTPRRGRGRPRKDQSAGAPEGQETAGVNPPKTERNIRASFVTRTLQIAHMIVSKAAQAPELELDTDDAKLLGDATAEVLKFYKVKMTAKQEAYGLLIEAAAQVYPPMFVSLYIRKMAEAEAKKQTAPPPPPKPAPQSAYTPRDMPRAPATFNDGFDPNKITIPEG